MSIIFESPHDNHTVILTVGENHASKTKVKIESPRSFQQKTNCGQAWVTFIAVSSDGT